MFLWFTLLRRLMFMYFTRALIYFWCCFTNGKNLKSGKKQKKICVVHRSCMNRWSVTTTTTGCTSERERGKKKSTGVTKRESSHLFCHPSWNLLRFHVGFLYQRLFISGAKMKIQLKYIYIHIYIYVGTKQFFGVSQLLGSEQSLKHYLCEPLAEPSGRGIHSYIAFTCTIFGTQLNGDDL
ncbi:unnamed protein product [Ixodes pacificus]